MISSLRHLIGVSDDHDRVLRTEQLEAVPTSHNILVALIVLVELRINTGFLADAAHDGHSRATSSREEQVGSTGSSRYAIDRLRHTSLQEHRHVHVEAVDVANEPQTVPKTSRDDTFPHRVIRHVDE